MEVATKQESIFLGDIVFYSYLERLSGKKHPLLTWADGGSVVSPTAENSREFVKRELKVTSLGRDVLAGTKDWQDVNTESRWLGGVEIEPGVPGWRWNPDERTLLRPSASKVTRRSGRREAAAKSSTRNRKPPTAKKKTTSSSAKKRSPRKRSK
jgi:hypothetical protein